MGCGAKSPGWAERLRERAYVTELMTLFYIFFLVLQHHSVSLTCFVYFCRCFVIVIVIIFVFAVFEFVGLHASIIWRLKQWYSEKREEKNIKNNNTSGGFNIKIKRRICRYLHSSVISLAHILIGGPRRWLLAVVVAVVVVVTVTPRKHRGNCEQCKSSHGGWRR